MRRQFFRPAPRSIWTVVSFAPQNFPLSEVEQSVNKLRQSCERLGEHPYRFLLRNLTLLLGMGKPSIGPRLFSMLIITGIDIAGGRAASAAGGVERVRVS